MGYFQGMSSAKWWNRKPHTLLLPTETLTQQYINQFPCEKSENMSRGSSTPGEHETSHINAWWSEGKFQLSWLLPWEGKRKLKPTSNILTCGVAERLPKGLASVLPESKHWQERVPGWGLLRIKVMVWTRIHSVAIVPPFPPTTQHRIRKPLFLPGEGKSWRVKSDIPSFQGASKGLVSVIPLSEH